MEHQSQDSLIFEWLMTKEDLIRRLKERDSLQKLTINQLDAVIEETLSIMTDALRNGQEVQLGDFGTFGLNMIRPIPIRRSRPSSKHSQKKRR